LFSGALVGCRERVTQKSTSACQASGGVLSAPRLCRRCAMQLLLWRLGTTFKSSALIHKNPRLLVKYMLTHALCMQTRRALEKKLLPRSWSGAGGGLPPSRSFLALLFPWWRRANAFLFPLLM